MRPQTELRRWPLALPLRVLLLPWNSNAESGSGGGGCSRGLLRLGDCAERFSSSPGLGAFFNFRLKKSHGLNQIDMRAPALLG